MCAGLIAFAATFAYFGSKLQTPTKEEAFFPQTHLFERTKNEIQDGFQAAATQNLVPVAAVMGIKLDRTGFDRWDPGAFRGKVQYDDNFDISEPSVRSAIEDFCGNLETAHCDGKCDSDYPDLLVVDGTFKCPIRDFNQWYNDANPAPATQASELSGDAFNTAIRNYWNMLALSRSEIAGNAWVRRRPTSVFGDRL